MIAGRTVLLALPFLATVLLAGTKRAQVPDSTWLSVERWQGRFSLTLKSQNCGYSTTGVESKQGELALSLEEVEECKLGPAGGWVSTNQFITGSLVFGTSTGPLAWRGSGSAEYKINDSTETYVLGEFMRGSIQHGEGKTDVGRGEFEIDLRDGSYSVYVYPGGKTPRGIKLTVSETFAGLPAETQESDADEAGLSGTSGWVVDFPLPRFGTMLCGSVDTEETALFTWRIWPADSSAESTAQQSATCSHWHPRNPLDASNDPVSLVDLVDQVPETHETAEPSNGLPAVDLFFVRLGDGGRTGEPVGCGDALVPVTVEGSATSELTSASDLTGQLLDQLDGQEERSSGRDGGATERALRRLLELDQEFVGVDSLYNALHASALKVEQVTQAGDLATVELSGVLVTARECDGKRLVGQLTATALKFPEVSQVSFLIYGEPIGSTLEERP